MKQEGIELSDMNAEGNPDLSKLMEVDDDEYIYRLVGVNVHIGTADRGHYYSLIDLKRGAGEPDPYGTDDKGKSKYQIDHILINKKSTIYIYDCKLSNNFTTSNYTALDLNLKIRYKHQKIFFKHLSADANCFIKTHINT